MLELFFNKQKEGGGVVKPGEEKLIPEDAGIWIFKNDTKINKPTDKDRDAQDIIYALAALDDMLGDIEDDVLLHLLYKAGAVDLTADKMREALRMAQVKLKGE